MEDGQHAVTVERSFWYCIPVVVTTLEKKSQLPNITPPGVLNQQIRILEACVLLL